MKQTMLLGLICLTFILTGCDSSKKNQNSTTNESVIKYASNLEIIVQDDLVLVHLLDPESNEIERRFALVKNSTQKAPQNYHPISVPIQSITALSGTHIGMLSKLNKTNLIVGISNDSYLYDSNVIQRFKAGKVMEMGDESQIPIESIIQSKTQLIMYSGFGKSFPHEKQLEKLGITCLANYDWRENHPLGKAEWIKLFGYLTGTQKKAFDYFNKVESSYKNLKKQAQNAQTKPSVISGNLLGDIWYAPAGESYNAHLFADANSNYIYAKTPGTGSSQHSLEEILLDTESTEFWFNPGYSSTKELISFNPKFVHLNPVKQQQVYCYWHKANRFWELSAIEPHMVLSDMIRIFHPSILPEGPYHFYKQLD